MKKNVDPRQRVLSALRDLREAIQHKKVKLNPHDPIAAFSLFSPSTDISAKYLFALMYTYFNEYRADGKTVPLIVDENDSSNVYSAVVEEAANGGTLEVDNQGRVVVPKVFTDIAQVRQDKTLLKDIQFYCYPEQISTEGIDLSYLALYDTKEGMGQRSERTLDDRRRIMLPKSQSLEDFLPKKNRIAFIGLRESIGVLNYDDFKKYQIQIHAYQLYTHFMCKMLSASSNHK